MASFTAMPRLMRRCSALLMGATPVELPPPAAGRKLGPRALAAAPICCLQHNIGSLRSYLSFLAQGVQYFLHDNTEELEFMLLLVAPFGCKVCLQPITPQVAHVKK